MVEIQLCHPSAVQLSVSPLHSQHLDSFINSSGSHTNAEKMVQNWAFRNFNI
jgi:hypothetical protein